MARLILDTGVLVAAGRGRLRSRAFTDEDDVALPAVALAEYLAGLHRDRDEERRAEQREFLSRVLAVVPVEDYTPSVAEHHAVLLAEVARTGTPRGAHDLIIAATARATARVLVTTDAKAKFEELSDVTVRLVPR
ncbi:PIN domain-containing protein [Amycolatopsis pithecellobii]|uniref:Ribonuclease VapC n=1 Tax=Amycolatopsis pithecellobii TaxID=664692 RepID=A0A6N7Z3V2_9PSEU|nr:PIN domain-containing protein [Amycolatopsis pithecellobii]MTD55899.1 PIN domain-containing protein [Amycolatopsis pithecellobii]